MHHISLGRPLKGTPVVLIINDLDIRVVNKTTGELIRHLTLNPDVGYQPRFKTKKNPNRGFEIFLCLETRHSVAGAGFEPATFGL